MADKPNREIERKFLVTEVPADLERYRRTRISQGYVAVDEKDELRVRERSGELTLTVKQGSGMSRYEAEVGLSKGLYRQLWVATEGRRVFKDRYEIPLEGNQYVLELDLYLEQLSGLRVAEIEFDSENQAMAFEPPPWLGREVTNDAAFKNRALAERSDLSGLRLT